MLKKQFYIASLLLFISILLNAANVFGAKMTNDDVIRLVKAGMSEELIISVIAKSETDFDTSTDAVIALSKKGVSQKIISAMVAHQNKGTTDVKGKEEVDVNKLNPEEIILLDNGQEKSMKYIIPEIRTAVRAFGFGGMATYMVLRGDHAQLRTTNRTPSFLVSVPKNVQPDSYITLANFAVRRNNSREVLMGGGYMSYSSGIHPDRIIPVTFEKIKDQSHATKDFVIYKLTPKSSLIRGEYAVILYTSEVRTIGFFGQASNSCFDFGID